MLHGHAGQDRGVGASDTTLRRSVEPGVIAAETLTGEVVRVTDGDPSAIRRGARATMVSAVTEDQSQVVSEN